MSRSRYIADFIVSSNDIANGTITFSDIGTVFTSNLIESGDTTSGNVYFTNARVDARIATTSINALSDVDVTGASPSQTLIWNGSTWTPGSPIVGSTEFSNSAVIANLANVANIANMVATISNFTTTNLREGSNLYFTNARVDARVATTSINTLSDVDITGITTNQVLSWNGTAFVPTSIASSGFANVANLANMVATISNFTTTNLAEGSNLYYTNTRVYSNVINTLQNYTGNISAGNITITGKFFGDGSALTGIGSGSGNVSLAGMATYKGNILAANITAQTIVASNITVGNVLSPTGSLLRFTNNTNTIINAGVFDSIFSDTGNVILPNVVIVGKIFGDGSALTGVSGSGGAANLTTLPVYNGNILAANITAQTVTATNVYANSFISTGVGTPTIQSGTNINLTANNAVVITNSVLRLRSYSTTDRNANITPQEGDIIYNSTDDVLQFYANGSWVSASGSSAVAGFANVANIANMVSTISNFSTTNLGEGTNLYYTNSRVYSNVINLLSTYTGNINAGNVIVTGKFVGDGSGLTGVTGSANLTTLPTYNGNALISNLVVTSNATIVGNIQANYFIGNGALLTGITAGGGASLSGMATYNGNILAVNVTATGFILAPNVHLGTSTSNTRIGASGTNNTIIRAGVFTSSFLDNGNVLLPNIVLGGKIFGDGSQLTGVLTSTAAFATYGGNILADNITSNTIITRNIRTTSGANISELTGSANVVLVAGVFASTFTDDGNVILPNLRIQGRLIGDGSGLSNISSASLNLPTYGGNILVNNVTANTVFTQSLIASTGNITAISGSSNVVLVAGAYSSRFTDDGNVTLPNVVIVGKIYGDGTGLTGITAAALAGMATYGANILASNVTASAFVLTPNLYIGNSLASSRITTSGGANTVITAGSYQTSFRNDGNVLLPNVVVQGKIYGDGSQITGITISPTAFATYGGNILATNVTATSFILAPNVHLGTSTANTRIGASGTNNTIIRAGGYLVSFLDNGNVLLPNIVLGGKIFGDGSQLTGVLTSTSVLATYGGNLLVDNVSANSVFTNSIRSTSGANIAVTSGGQNVVIMAGVFASTFTDVGNVVIPNLTVTGRLTGDAAGLSNISSASLNLPTYNGNLLVNNLTAQVVVVTNRVTFSAGGNLAVIPNSANVVLSTGVYSSNFNEDGNVYLPNVVVTGRYFGNGAGITNLVISSQAISSVLPTYNGNILAANITVTTITGTSSTANLTSRSDSNTIIISGGYSFTFRDTGRFITTTSLASGGMYIGTDTNTNTLLDDASNGSGSTTMYIGNQAITTSSDIRLKNVIGNTSVQAVNVVSNLRVVDFTWDDPTDTSFNNKNARGVWTGLIAQEVINNVPYVVNAVRDQETLQPIPNSMDQFGRKQYWGLEYDKLVPILIKAVQEQQIMINDLQARITALESNK